MILFVRPSLDCGPLYPVVRAAEYEFLFFFLKKRKDPVLRIVYLSRQERRRIG